MNMGRASTRYIKSKIKAANLSLAGETAKQTPASTAPAKKHKQITRESL